ncbi:antibiotic biosynthesis monooxygenase family protein [Microvirga arsenatis]|uniref:Antibiotic biosynthesis monooxygenase n=1 Tax=Microvirga arsenatis TaxID=2692265 RepID=A0ABW9YZG3_9HYPH|nr:antibiotic biosynthesis monooxygenase [Microvirga arsenatis]NBJ10221.1 antibiotic biosynthesis monooxygenase [Microvirga arsenatis]NBJ24880.1 antibiotic biosynthesis monooxygenase [Microvirga arsenatis]
MIAVIFEVWPDGEDGMRHYLGLAAALLADLKAMDGFISVERFQSLSEPGKLLSLSFWRDEEAVRAWRNLPSHRATQGAGRAGVFRDYRLRVAAVIRDYGLDERDEAPADSRAAHAASDDEELLGAHREIGRQAGDEHLLE